MKHYYWLVVLISLSVSGCASWLETEPQQLPKYTAPHLIDQNYSVSGRFAIVTVSDNYYGNYAWEHESNNDQLELTSPLGNTIAQIKVESGVASLTTRGTTYQGSDLDQLLMQNLGFILPIKYLHYWLQGVALPNYAVTEHNPAGFNQLGWQIRYLRWQDLNHPQLIEVKQQELRIKLFINWPAESQEVCW